MKLIVGLGNPGNRYRTTRHNVGFMAIDSLADYLQTCEPWRENKKCNGQIIRCSKNELLLLKPQTFMNESGKTVQSALNFFKIQPSDLCVLHDDLDLPFGTYKIQHGRGSAGHNGVESIFTHINSRDFTRVRIGIANNEPREVGADFVLSPFTKDEKKQLPEILKKISNDLLKYLDSHKS